MTARTSESRAVDKERRQGPGGYPSGQLRFVDIRPNVKLSDLGVELNFIAVDQSGHEWAFDVSGAFTSSRAGLRRTDTLWKALGKAAVLHEGRSGLPLILLTTDAPTRGSAGNSALKVMTDPAFQSSTSLSCSTKATKNGFTTTRCGDIRIGEMPSERTLVTEIATGLGMLGDDDLASVVSRRPTQISSLDSRTWERISTLWREGSYNADFRSGFLNGRAFLEAPDALNGRRTKDHRVDGQSSSTWGRGSPLRPAR